MLSWTTCPALLYGLSALHGFGFAFSKSYSISFSFVLLIFTLLNQKLRLMLTAAVFFSTYLFGVCYLASPSLPKEGIKGIAEIKLDQITSQSASHFENWVYSGSLRKLQTDTHTYFFPNLPCTIKLSKKGLEERPPADHLYEIAGTLKEIAPKKFLLAKTHPPWKQIKPALTFAEWRFRMKCSLQIFIQDHLQHQQSAQFLAGIATGDFDDRYLSFEFGRFGLQHIMAISGFHFAIIAMILNTFLRLMLPSKPTSFFLLLSLSGYFIFLGPRPSVLRAWVMISLALGSQLLEKPVNSLNSLGIALLAILLYHPPFVMHLGFQFSFATTFAILLFYPIMNRLCQKLTPSRNKEILSKMPLLDKHGLLILCFFRQAIALTAAVNLVAIPMMLFFFQKFPIMSLLYNLFFPFLISLSMLLLLLGFILFPFKKIFFFLNDSFTNSLINLTYYMPLSIDFTWRVPPFSADLLILYLSLLFLIGMILRRRSEQILFI